MIVKGNTYTEDGNDLTIFKVDEYWEYEYDLLNRMTAVSKWDEDAEEMLPVKSYRYNGSNYRVVATDSEGNSSYYSFDTNGQMVEKTRVEYTTEATRDYIYLGTRVIAHVEDGESRYYGTDHIGSTVLMTNEAGEIVWSGEVTPFADQESVSDESEHVLYTGKELDEATGLYYYNARWYDPNLGRFTTEDPIRAGNNWFVYANSNPLKYVDPTGLDPFKLDGAEEASVDGVDSLIKDTNELAEWYRDASAEAAQNASDPITWAVNSVGAVVGAAAAAIIPDDAEQAGEMAFVGSQLAPYAEGAVNGAKALWGKLFNKADDAAKAVASSADDVVAATDSGTTAVQSYYPGKNGALGETTNEFLYKGTLIDRYGGSGYSRFFSPAGTPAEARALPPGTASQPLRTFEVLKPFEVGKSTVAPAFGEPGLGIQYRSPVQLDTLLKKGILGEVGN